MDQSSDAGNAAQRLAPPAGSGLRPWLALLPLLISGLLVSNGREDDSLVNITLLQLNDVYEIHPTADLDKGGLARVAGIRKSLLAANRNTYTLLAGDFLSPSPMGNVEVMGEVLAGRQMVDVLKMVGLDVATLGNHEFDLKEDQLKARLAEGAPGVTWLSANVKRADTTDVPHVHPHKVLSAFSAGGRPFRIGVIGLTLPTGSDYVIYESPIEAAQRQARALRPQVDILIALTHQDEKDDKDLANQVPDFDLILGGHEHTARFLVEGPKATPITKADANARTVWIHRLVFNTRDRKISRSSELAPVDSTTPVDDYVRQRATEWSECIFSALRTKGFEPTEVIATTAPLLDGADQLVRAQPTNLTRLVAQSMLQALPEAEVALFNSGSIRIDGSLGPGKLTQWDVFRVLPYDGSLALVRMSGHALIDVLNLNLTKVGDGDGHFLQSANVDTDAGNWRVSGTVIKPDRIYKVVINDYLLRGAGAGFPVLSPLAGGVVLEPGSPVADAKKALINTIRRTWGPPAAAPAAVTSGTNANADMARLCSPLMKAPV